MHVRADGYSDNFVALYLRSCFAAMLWGKYTLSWKVNDHAWPMASTISTVSLFA